MAGNLTKTIEGIIPEIIALRHEIHQHPEIRFEERWTSDRIAQFLDQAGIEYQRGYGRGTGIVATLRGVGSRTVALRADMDALEIQEETGLPYASQIPYRMHACGHDGHAACLCGAAQVLARHKVELFGTVKFIFQPAEEMAGGGRLMVEQGVLEDVDAAFALHGWPSIPVGHVALKPGWIMAGAQDFRILVRGAGCHGADPRSGIDPVVPAAHITTALHTIVGREINPWETAVVTVSIIQAGHATNIIPEVAELQGTIRTLTPQLQQTVAESVRRMAKDIARAFRASAEIELGGEPYPPLYNDPTMTEFVRRAVVEELGKERLVDLEAPCMASEDFAFYLQRVPGVFMYLGVNPEPEKPYPPLHSPRYNFPDEAIPPGIRLLSALAIRFLSCPQSS